MPDENKATEPPFKPASEVFGSSHATGLPTPGLSQSPGLRDLADSPVPGADRNHVLGPQQSAVDPVLAGLDTGYNPLSRNEDRVINRTDGSMTVPPPDSASETLPGPSGVSSPAVAGAAEAAALVTPTAEPAAAPTPASPPVEQPPASKPVRLNSSGKSE